MWNGTLWTSRWKISFREREHNQWRTGKSSQRWIVISCFEVTGWELLTRNHVATKVCTFHKWTKKLLESELHGNGELYIFVSSSCRIIILPASSLCRQDWVKHVLQQDTGRTADLHREKSWTTHQFNDKCLRHSAITKLSARLPWERHGHTLRGAWTSSPNKGLARPLHNGKMEGKVKRKRGLNSLLPWLCMVGFDVLWEGLSWCRTGNWWRYVERRTIDDDRWLIGLRMQKPYVRHALTPSCSACSANLLIDGFHLLGS